MTVFIQQEHNSQHAAVHQLLVDAFGQEDEARLVDMLRSDTCFIPELSLVATIDEKIVGYILFTRIFISSGEQRHESLALAPLAVDPAYQHRGIGGQLIIEGHRRATALGYHSIFVLGHEHYYPRFGYKPAARWNISCPFPAPTEAFMGIALKPGSLKDIKGEVEYGQPFYSL